MNQGAISSNKKKMSPFRIMTGWRFCPEDIELIRDYLYNKVMGQKLPIEGIIVECDLYGNENPWQIWEKFNEYVVKTTQCEDLYVFTKLKRKNLQAKHIERKVGFGSWEGEALAKKILINNSNDNQRVIGFMKRFRFEKSRTDQDGKWIMHEYSLNPSLFPSQSEMKDYVVCRIRNNDRAVKLKKKRKEAAENQPTNYEEQRGNQRNKKIRTGPKENIQKQVCEESKDNQRIIIQPAKSKEEETNMSLDDFCSWLETNLSSDQGEKNKENQTNPPAKMEEEDTNMSVDDFCSWLETNLSSNDDQGEKNEGNLFRTEVNSEEYFNMPTSNMLDNVDLFLEQENASSTYNFTSWTNDFLRGIEGEWQKMLTL